ncbi:MAG TPA: DUF1127 domain-containing protein [Burkholderiaceae bacterium]|nr:DUF1127 domain-containing protein [Burkholderiaceae bacterium]
MQVTSRSQTGSVDPAARPAAYASGSTWWIMRGVAGLVATLRIWWERSSARAQLRQMDDYRLADIGLSRAEAQAEAAKPFWRA